MRCSLEWVVDGLAGTLPHVGHITDGRLLDCDNRPLEKRGLGGGREKRRLNTRSGLARSVLSVSLLAAVFGRAGDAGGTVAMAGPLPAGWMDGSANWPPSRDSPATRGGTANGGATSSRPVGDVVAADWGWQARELAPRSNDPTRPGVYGTWHADSLANLEVGYPRGRQVAFRIRAAYTGLADRVTLWLTTMTHGECLVRRGQACRCKPGRCYANGTGGSVLVELRADDGTPNHGPSVTTLASALITDPLKQWNRTVVFDTPATLIAGTLYHVLLTNTDGRPTVNYVGVNCLDHHSGLGGQIQPGISGTDLAVVSKLQADDKWRIHFDRTPIYSLLFVDGRGQGVGYVDVPVGTDTRAIGGRNKVRQTITVTGLEKVVSSVSVRVARGGNTGPLTVRLERGDGGLIEQGIVPAILVGTAMTWVEYTFTGRGAPYALQPGERYHIVLSAQDGDPYSVFPLQKGLHYGFRNGVFLGGAFEYSSGGPWQGRGDADMQFYFTLANAGPRYRDPASAQVTRSAPVQPEWRELR